MKFVFEATIRPGCTEQQYIDAWTTGSTLIQKEPGALGTRLHRKIGASGTLLAIASWESREHRNSAIAKLREDPTTCALIDRHEQFADTRIVGEFDEPQWQVLPPA